jgi:hypothetical protein
VRSKLCLGPCGNYYPVTYFWADVNASDGHMSRCPSCEGLVRAERAKQRAAGELQGKPDRNGRVVAYSEEERRRRSELAKRLHAEGRFSGRAIGAVGGRAPARHRVADAVLEHFRQPDQQALVIKAYESNLRSKSKPQRLRAAEAIMSREENADKRMMAERGGAVDPAAMTQEELEEFVRQGLEAMIARGEVPVDVELGEDAVRDVS